MDVIGALILWVVAVCMGIIFASVAVSFLPDAVKDWIKKKLFKEEK